LKSIARTASGFAFVAYIFNKSGGGGGGGWGLPIHQIEVIRAATL